MDKILRRRVASSPEIPQGTKVAYYNQQAKEKEVLVEGIRYVDARV